MFSEKSEKQGRRLLLIDNYDSFTYILAHYLGEFLRGEVLIVKNDEINLKQAINFNPDFLVISPGPGTVLNKEDIGNSFEIFSYFYDKIPVLGVCLGHQFIADFFGGKIVNAPLVMHGKKSQIINTGKGIFWGLAPKFSVMRYHSLLAEASSFPKQLEVTAKTSDNLIMAFQHKQLPVFGVQFHPESIGSEFGKKMIENFLNTSN